MRPKTYLWHNNILPVSGAALNSVGDRVVAPQAVLAVWMMEKVTGWEPQLILLKQWSVIQMKK